MPLGRSWQTTVRLKIKSYYTVDWQTAFLFNKALTLTVGVKNSVRYDPPLSLRSDRCPHAGLLTTATTARWDAPGRRSSTLSVLSPGSARLVSAPAGHEPAGILLTSDAFELEIPDMNFGQHSESDEAFLLVSRLSSCSTASGSMP